MEENTTITDKVTEWRRNVEPFVNSFEFKDTANKETLRDGVNGLIDIAEQQSCNGWALTDGACPDCTDTCVFDFKAKIITTQHKSKEVRHHYGGKLSTGLAYECCECGKILMTSPTAIITPTLPGELETTNIVDNAQTQLPVNNTANNQDAYSNNQKHEKNIDTTQIENALDILSEKLPVTEWEPGEKSVFADNNYIIETTVNAYPAEICNGTTHYDTIGEQLTTLEYTCSATNKILSQTIGGKLQRRFNLQ